MPEKQIGSWFQPLSIELKQLDAYLAFLTYDTWDEISQATGEKINTLKRWQRRLGWVQRRNKFYKDMQNAMDRKLETIAQDVAEMQVDLAKKLMIKTNQLLDDKLQETDPGSVKDFMIGIGAAVDAVDKLLNIIPREEKVEPGTLQFSVEQKEHFQKVMGSLKVSLPVPEEEEKIGEKIL